MLVGKRGSTSVPFSWLPSFAQDQFKQLSQGKLHVKQAWSSSSTGSVHYPSLGTTSGPILQQCAYSQESDGRLTSPWSFGWWFCLTCNSFQNNSLAQWELFLLLLPPVSWGVKLWFTCEVTCQMPLQLPGPCCTHTNILPLIVHRKKKTAYIFTIADSICVSESMIYNAVPVPREVTE